MLALLKPLNRWLPGPANGPVVSNALAATEATVPADGATMFPPRGQAHPCEADTLDITIDDVEPQAQRPLHARSRMAIPLTGGTERLQEVRRFGRGNAQLSKGTQLVSSHPVLSPCGARVTAINHDAATGEYRIALHGRDASVVVHQLRLGVEVGTFLPEGTQLGSVFPDVIPAKPGKVRRVGDMGSEHLGKYVVLEHAEGALTIYGQLRVINPDLKIGMQVTHEVLGGMGGSGAAPGPVLNFGVFYCANRLRPTNDGYLTPEGITLHPDDVHWHKPCGGWYVNPARVLPAFGPALRRANRSVAH